MLDQHRQHLILAAKYAVVFPADRIKVGVNLRQACNIRIIPTSLVGRQKAVAPVGQLAPRGITDAVPWRYKPIQQAWHIDGFQELPATAQVLFLQGQIAVIAHFRSGCAFRLMVCMNQPVL